MSDERPAGQAAEQASAHTVAVVVGGAPIRPPDRNFDAVVVADSGLDVALAAGLQPTWLVGDLDSISPIGLQWAQQHGVPIERHPADKDDTDTALALRCAASLGADELVVLGADITSRLDHLLATLVCLGDASLASFQRITAALGSTHVHVLHPGHRVCLTLPTDRVFSLLALHGDCAGVDVTDARWPLCDAVVAAGSSLGISNQSLGRPVTVSVTSGVLTIIVPEVVS
jgi:thiamine pyrophosphokinase